MKRAIIESLFLMFVALLSACLVAPSIQHVEGPLLTPEPGVIQVPAGDSVVIRPGDAITFVVLVEGAAKEVNPRRYSFNYQNLGEGSELKGEGGCRF